MGGSGSLEWAETVGSGSLERAEMGGRGSLETCSAAVLQQFVHYGRAKHVGLPWRAIDRNQMSFCGVVMENAGLIALNLIARPG